MCNQIFGFRTVAWLLAGLLWLPLSARAQEDTASTAARVASATASDGAAGATVADPAALAEGKTLFNNACTSCHAVTGEVVIGPGLKGILERRPIDWLIPWIHNSQKVIASGDAYAVALYEKYNKTVMPGFPSYTEQQIKNIFAYIKSEDAPKPAATAGTGAAATGGGGGGNGAAMGGVSSDMFLIVVGALMVVLLLVLVVLVLVVTVLSKAVNQQQGLAVATAQPDEEFSKVDLKNVVRSNMFKAGVAILFTLVAGKATIDGLYDIGVQQGYAPTQPIAFSHKLHAGQYQMQCRYCHTGVYASKSANIPSANICMNCHNAIKRESPEIQKIYAAIETNKPIEWVRVHNLPDLAYFNHAQHTKVGGLACQNCHGEIQAMEVVQQRSSLTMGWCIDCHRKTNVNAEGNAYYDKLVSLHKKNSREPLKAVNIGALECSKCHY